MKTRHLILGLAFALAATQAEAVQYTVTEIITPSTLNGGLQATYANARGINNSGVVVGEYGLAANTRSGFVYDQDTAASNEFFNPSYPGYLTGINDSGHVVGSMIFGSGGGFYYDGNAFTELYGPWGGQQYYTDINNSGQIAGRYRDDATGLYHGIVYGNGAYTQFDVAGMENTYLRAINDAGDLAGYYIDPVFGTQGFIYSNGVLEHVYMPGSTSTLLFGINNLGQAVGRYFDSMGYSHGLIYDNGVYTTLDFDQLLPYTVLVDINDLGTVVGYAGAVGASFNAWAFMATPVNEAVPTPEPSTVLLIGGGAAAMALWARRRKKG